MRFVRSMRELKQEIVVCVFEIWVVLIRITGNKLHFNSGEFKSAIHWLKTFRDVPMRKV